MDSAEGQRREPLMAAFSSFSCASAQFATSPKSKSGCGTLASGPKLPHPSAPQGEASIGSRALACALVCSRSVCAFVGVSSSERTTESSPTRARSSTRAMNLPRGKCDISRKYSCIYALLQYF